MFWETVAAVILIVGTPPLWLLVALAWGFLSGAWFFLVAGFSIVTEWAISEIWGVPVVAVVEAFSSAWSVPVEIWAWGKFEHPWWAAIIGLFCIGAAKSRDR